MSNEIYENRAYRTSDYITASILLLKKHILIDIDRTNPQRAVFQFEQTQGLESDLQDLQSGRLLVDPHDFWYAQRRCKQLIYEGARV